MFDCPARMKTFSGAAWSDAAMRRKARMRFMMI
jgi:hypothetical protein